MAQTLLILSCFRAVVGGLSAVHRHSILAAIFMTVIVLEPDTVVGSREYPGPAAVIADMEGNADLIVAALPHVHHQSLPGERTVVRRRLVHRHAACVSLAAMLCNKRHEIVRRQTCLGTAVSTVLPAVAAGREDQDDCRAED
jgi:hypothetical protein